MVDTVRSMAQLLAAFADGQGAGAITPQDLRDLIVSSIGQTGWADYTDDQYTDASPQALAANTVSTVEINGATSQVQELPFAITSLWDGTNDEIPITTPGTSLIVTFETTIRRASGTGRWEFDIWIDIGLPGDIRLYPRTIAIDNGDNDKSITFTTGVYCLDTWAANGGQIKINPEIAAEIHSSRIVVHHLHRGRGTYPPT